MNKERRFVCPRCEQGVEKVTQALILETESINPRDGEVLELESCETEEVLWIEYVCARGCGWRASEQEWEAIYGI